MSLNKKNADYWQNRAIHIESKLNENVEETLKRIESINKGLQLKLNKEINYWANRFAANNELNYQDAKKLLNSDELEEFKLTVDDYIKMGKENGVYKDWNTELVNMSARVHISRLEAMKTSLVHYAEVFIANEHKLIEDTIIATIKDSYYMNTYEIAKGLGIKVNLYRLDENLLKNIIKKSWTSDGIEFSERIWGKYRPELVNYLDKELKQNLIMGRNPNKLAKNLSDSFGVKKHQAENLLRTETAYFQQEAQAMCFDDLNVDKYRIVATLDHRTSPICRQMDFKVFDEKDREVGVNAPPFHCRCRTTTAPYFEDEIDIKRMMRDSNNKSVYVENLSYEEWYKKYVETDEDLLAIHKKYKSFSNRKM